MFKGKEKERGKGNENENENDKETGFDTVNTDVILFQESTDPKIRAELEKEVRSRGLDKEVTRANIDEVNLKIYKIFIDILVARLGES